MKKNYHLSLSVKGALRNWTKKSYKGFISKNGRELSFFEARDLLLDQLAEGIEVICYSECDNFDTKKGCQGHAQKETL